MARPCRAFRGHRNMGQVCTRGGPEPGSHRPSLPMARPFRSRGGMLPFVAPSELALSWTRPCAHR